MRIYKNHKKERRKNKEAKKCIGCEDNQEGFCIKFMRFCSAAILECLVKKSGKTMQEIFASINKAVTEKKERIHKDIINKK